MKTLLLCLAVILFYINSHAQTWSTTGNSGTTPPKNFLGTLDANALQFKVNSQPSGYIDYIASKANTSFGYQSLKGLTGSSNTAFGYKASYSNSSGKNNVSLGAYALYFNTTGYSNIAVGIGALYKNTTYSNIVAVGDSALYNNGIGANQSYQSIANTAIGSKALYTNTTGYKNTAIGFQSMLSNTAGNVNTATGYQAMYANTTGAGCSAYGASSLYNNTSGFANTAIGFYTMYTNTTGGYNTAAGSYSMEYNTTGSYNTAYGYASLLFTTTGAYNTAIGHNTLLYNTTGGYNTGTGDDVLYKNTSGSNNSSTGFESLYTNTTGTDNDAKGYQSLYTNTTGSYNVAEGATSLYYNTSGSYNTAIGVNALYNNIGSSYNTALGFLALGFADVPGADNVAVGAFAGPTVNTDGVYNSVAVGEDCYNTASNQARIGNSGTTSIGGYVNWSNISDGRVKKNIKQNVPGLAFISKLQPVTYNLDLEAADKIIKAQRKDSTGKIIPLSQDELAARKTKEQVLYSGFIAQDVEKSARSLNYNFSGVDAAKNDKDLYGLRYAEFVVPLVKAVQELSKINEEKDSLISNLENRLTKIETMMTSGSQQSITGNQSIQLSLTNTASLSQNIPNPFGNTTNIAYTLPRVYSSAKIIITSQAGVVLKQTSLSGTKGSVSIDTSTLSAGAYQYSLYVDGRLVDSKQMIASK